MNVINIERTIEMLHEIEDATFDMAAFIYHPHLRDERNLDFKTHAICQNWPFGDDIPPGVTMCLAGHIANNFAWNQRANCALVGRFFDVNTIVASNLCALARTYGKPRLSMVTKEDVIEKLESMI